MNNDKQNPMETYLQLTAAKLATASDLHLTALLEEINSGHKTGPLTGTYVDDVLQRMVAHGSSKDVLLYGVPDALRLVEIEILKACADRWQTLLKRLRLKEEPIRIEEPVWPKEN